jgi:hypothetical protein
MNATVNDHTISLNRTVERLVTEHGFRAVTAALMRRFVQRQLVLEGPAIGDLTDHIRRDIGLPVTEVQRPVPPVPPFPPLR